MDVKRIFTLLTLIIAFKQIKCNKNLEIKMLNDFLTYDKLSVSVITFLCWNRDEINQLSQMVFNQNIYLSVRSTDKPDISNIDSNLIFILDLNCEYSNILRQVNNQNLFKPLYKWLLLTESLDIFDRLKTDLSDLNILMDSDVIIAQKINNTQYELTEIYRKAPSRTDFIQNVVMTWDEIAKFGKFKRRHLAFERRNLDRTMVKSSVVFTNNDTNTHLTDYRNPHIDSVTKVNFRLTNLLIDFVNGTTQYYPVDSWGYPSKENNSYTGMVGFLLRKEVDIGGTALFMTEARLPLIKYIGMTTSTKLKFVFRSPPLSYQSNIFTLPFTKTLWISVFALVILIIILLYIAVYMEWRQPERPETDNALQNSILEVVMLTMSAVAQQGATSEPRSGAGKIIMYLAFISLMFLYVSYSANIVALLQSTSDNIKTLEDLSKSRLKLGVEDNVYNRYYFETATEPIQKEIYTKKIAPPGKKPNFIPMEDGIKRLRQGFFAFHVELGPGYKVMGDTFYESEKCGLQEITFLNIYDVYLSIQKNSSYTEVFKIGLQKISESGLRQCEIGRIYAKKPDCHTGGGSFISVGLIDSYPAFLFLAGGVGLSIMLFIIEIIAFKKGVHCY